MLLTGEILHGNAEKKTEKLVHWIVFCRVFKSYYSRIHIRKNALRTCTACTTVTAILMKGDRLFFFNWLGIFYLAASPHQTHYLFLNLLIADRKFEIRHTF